MAVHRLYGIRLQTDEYCLSVDRCKPWVCMGSQTLADLRVYGHNLHEGLEPRSCPISVNIIIYGVNEVVKSNSKVKSFFLLEV